MIKDILLIEYNKSDEGLKSKLEGLKKYVLTIVNDYDSFLDEFNKKKYDICLINIKNKKERDFVIYYICHQEANQKILTCDKNPKNCYFQKNCELCKKYKIKTFKSYSNTKYIEFCIDNFNRYRRKPCKSI